jgi:hypothetical protein
MLAAGGLALAMAAVPGCALLSTLRVPQPWAAQEPVISTSFADVDGPAELPDELGADAPYRTLTSLPRTSTGAFVLRPGFYTLYAESYCLHAGTHGPSRGDGYLRAPLRGAGSDIIRSLLRSARSRGKIPQADVQMLLWAIEARAGLRTLSPRLQQAAEVLLSPEDRARIEGSVLDRLPPEVLELAVRQLPPPARRIYEAQARLRDLLWTTQATYDEVRQLAVLPALDGGSPIPRGRWSKHPDGIYMRFFPDGYSRTRINVFVPPPEQGPRTATLLDLTGDVAVPANTSSQRIGFSSAPVANNDSQPADPDDCSTYSRNIGKGRSPESWYDRYGMPILLPNSYWTNENTVEHGLGIDQRLWIAAQGFIETNGVFPGDNNIWNLQLDVKECTDKTQIKDVIEYVCPEQPAHIKLPPKWPPSRVTSDGKTMWACLRKICRASFKTPVDAVNGYMAFNKKRFPDLFKVVNDPGSTLEEFSRAARGFGSHPSYNADHIRCLLISVLRGLGAYLATRISLYDNSLACYARMGDEAPASFVETLKDQRTELQQMRDAIGALRPCPAASPRPPGG